MARVAGLSQSASINIFANREQVSFFNRVDIIYGKVQGLRKFVVYFEEFLKTTCHLVQ